MIDFISTKLTNTKTILLIELTLHQIFQKSNKILLINSYNTTYIGLIIDGVQFIRWKLRNRFSSIEYMPKNAWRIDPNK